MEVQTNWFSGLYVFELSVFFGAGTALALKRGSTLRVVGRDQGFVGMGMRGLEIPEIWPRFCAEWIKLMIDAVALDASAP